MTQPSLVTARDTVLTGRTILVLLLAFFGVVFAVNAYFAAMAIATYSGSVASEPYRKGLTYNKRIAADERQDALHWQTHLTASRDGQAQFDLAGPDGSPLPGMNVTVWLGRPSSEDQDRRLSFTEVAPGRYIAAGAALEPGRWIVALQVREAADAPEPVFQLRKRLWLNP